MLIEIHAIQNHSPANLNRDDLGAPKTCYFGGVLRSRISSQCIKRSIRMSESFKNLRGGIRTRRLAELIKNEINGDTATRRRVAEYLKECGIKSRESDDLSDMLVYTTHEAIQQMAALLQNDEGIEKNDIVSEFKIIIAEQTAVPDMALSGRMLETGKIDNTTVEAALQVAHAISTHEARPEVDYYVAADDVPGNDAGAGFVDEAMYSSACFYKYFSINWDLLVGNLNGNTMLAAHTVGAFLQAAAFTNPTGKQNSFAAHNLPDGILVEFKATPVSYSNAFATPVSSESRNGIIQQSILHLAQYVHDIDTGYGKPATRFWFSPGLRHPLSIIQDEQTVELTKHNFNSFSNLLGSTISELGFDWNEVQDVIVSNEQKLVAS